MSQIYKNIKNSASKDFKSYATQNDLPLSNVVEGSIAYVESVRTLYIFDSGAWYGIRLSNDPPIILSAPPARILLQQGETYTFELQAEDPDGLPVLWSYEVVEGDASGNPITLLGNQFSLTASNVGKAFVIRFSVNDGALAASSESRFVLDVYEGLQGDASFGAAIQLNMPYSLNFTLESIYNFYQFDDIGNNVLRRNADGWHFNPDSVSLYFYVGSGSYPDATRSTTNTPHILMNDRLFVATNNQFQERSNTNINSGIATPYSCSITTAAFNTAKVVSDQSSTTVWLLATDTSDDRLLHVVQVLIGTNSITELNTRTFNLNRAPVGGTWLGLSGNKLVIAWNDPSYQSVGWGFIAVDKDTFVDINSWTEEDTYVSAGAFTMCQNYLFYTRANPYGVIRMFDMQGDSIVEITNWLPSEVTDSSLCNVDLMSERLIITGDSNFYLFDFDSNNGTFSFVRSFAIPYGNSFEGYNTQIRGQSLIVGARDSSHSYVYPLLTGGATLPSANNINTEEKVYVGDTFTFTINGTEPNDRALDYTYTTNSRQTVGETLDVDINTGVVTLSPTSVGDFVLDVVYSLEDTQGDITQYPQTIKVSSRQGPGASINNYISTESGYSFVNSGYEQPSYYPKGLYVRGGIAVSQIENRTLLINLGLGNNTNNYWTAVADISSCLIYYRSSTEIYKITVGGVQRFSSISNLNSNTVTSQCWTASDIGINMTDNVELGAWYEPADGSDVLWWANHESRVIAFDISDPNNWAYLGISSNSTSNQGHRWSADNDEWICVSHDFGNNVQRLAFIEKESGSSLTTRYAGLPAFTHSDNDSPKYAMSRDYIFYTLDKGTLTGTSDSSNGWIVVYLMDENKTSFSEVERVRVPQNGSNTYITDIRFEDEVLYVMVYDTSPQTYVHTYQWDYVNETLTTVSTNRRCETYGDGVMWIDSGGVYTSNDRGNGQIFLTKFRGA